VSTRRMYAGRMRTLEQIERRREWKRQHGDNARRVMVMGSYGFMAASPELARAFEMEALERIMPSYIAMQERHAKARRQLNEELATMTPEELLKATADFDGSFSLEETRLCVATKRVPTGKLA
jgi:hypothetical protein